MNRSGACKGGRGEGAGGVEGGGEARQERRGGGRWRKEGESEGGKGRGGCTQFVHGHSRMTIDPRIPTIPGRRTLGFH